jgi:hypothetical protein
MEVSKMVGSDELARRLRIMKAQGIDIKSTLAFSVDDGQLTLEQGLEVAALLGGDL